MSVRNLLKRGLFSVNFALVSPLIVLAWVEKRVSDSENLFVGLGQLLSLFPGKIGSYLRAAYYVGTLESCSWEIHIGFGSFFSHRAAVLGSHVAMGSYCVIGTVSVENDTMMASHVSITSGKRQHFDDNGEVTPIPRFDRVTIGSKTWIGEGAIVLADVGSECIVSAGAVVTEEIPDGQLIGGNPAKLIKFVREFHREAIGADTSGNK